MMPVRQIRIKAGLVGLLACGLVGSFTPQASAATATSPWVYYGPVHGYSYKNRATVSTTPRIYAVTGVYNQSTGNVPSGYLGALARLYRNQTLCTQTGYVYNSGSANGMDVVTTGSSCGSGTYYSYGVSKAYNGNGYDAYFTYESPHLSATQAAVGPRESQSAAASHRSPAESAWPTNGKGETYGSGMDATSLQHEPDLIEAYATNGKVGYVKRVDLESEPNPRSPREALRVQERLAGQMRSVPVYGVNGNTKIGWFTVSHTSNAAAREFH